MKRIVSIIVLGIVIYGAALAIQKAVSKSQRSGDPREATNATVPGTPPKADGHEAANDVPSAPAPAGPVPPSLLPVPRQPIIDRMLAYNRRSLGEAYEQIGQKSPAWDEQVRSALEAGARYFSTPGKDRAKLAHDSAQKAIDAGSRDPMILYLRVRTAPPATPVFESNQGYLDAAKALENSAYPAVRRANALRLAAAIRAKRKSNPQEHAEAERLLDAALRLLTESARQEERGPDIESVWYEIAQEALDTYKVLGHDSVRMLGTIEDILATESKLEATRLFLRGKFYVHWAWQARGNGTADTVTPDGWEKFHQRMAVARAALERSFELAPYSARAAYYMLIVERADKRGRDAMEMWFDRAIRLDPSIKVCAQKLDWLHPKWHGSVEEMIEFGRQCRDSQNWDHAIPLTIAHAHFQVANWMPDNDTKLKYFRLANVSADIRYVYLEYLRRHPEAHGFRTEYACFCYWCGRPAEAHQQFERLGSDLKWGGQFTEKLVKQIRSNAATQAGK